MEKTKHGPATEDLDTTYFKQKTALSKILGDRFYVLIELEILLEYSGPAQRSESCSSTDELMGRPEEAI